MKYEDEPFNFIHTYLVSVNPGKVRANHYHKKKEEWIAITAGKIALLLKDMRSGEVDKIIMDTNSEKQEIIYIPPFVAHAVQNISNTEANLIVFSKNSEDKEDTIPHEVLNDPIWTSID
ncbi:WxcM-like domain-containing protein [Methanococcoides seepicolus]|uniref:WxcM-like domain-containing protein n=1 Tax=Methanococcoides seepicolus TaxID=2828780 RepID=A0A9E5DB14_9EURY|nr:WxcM-like domain-containing protein [Methanococcoides seepicolus]MCM1987220.1 WxcM-like domain-containing protein [Methanococcoides seepicolus]